jgi:hypothetical protein
VIEGYKDTFPPENHVGFVMVMRKYLYYNIHCCRKAAGEKRKSFRAEETPMRTRNAHARKQIGE